MTKTKKREVNFHWGCTSCQYQETTTDPRMPKDWLWVSVSAWRVEPARAQWLPVCSPGCAGTLVEAEAAALLDRISPSEESTSDAARS